MIKELTSKNFKKEVLESKEPAMVDFYADWCGPCKQMAPIIDEVAKEEKGKIKIFKVNIEKAESISNQYGIMSIPTFLFFKNGKLADQASGAMTKAKLLKLIKKL